MPRIRTSILVGSFLVALALWLTVTLGNTYVTQISVPLTVVGMPPDLALAEPLPDAVDVTLEGSGWQLLFLRLGSQPVLELPAARLRTGQVLLTNHLLGEALKLPQGIHALQVFPESLTVRTDAYAERKVPLRPKIDSLHFREHFGVTGAISLDPDSVVLMGAEHVLRSISSWPLVRRSFTDVAFPVAEDVRVADSLPGVVRFDPDVVRMYIPVEQIVDVEFNAIPVTVTGVPTGELVSLSPSSISVVARGGLNRLSTLDAKDFRASIAYAVILADTTGLVTPDVHAPEGTEVLRLGPPGIRYTIRRER